jgi:hypothetical protein
MKFCLVTGLSGWRNGCRNIGVFQLSAYDQRKGTRACSPLISAFFNRMLLNGISFFFSLKIKSNTDEHRQNH